jgi:spermidine synthase
MSFMTESVALSASPFRATWPADNGLRMLLTTFAILALELAMIRWVGTQIRVAAYFSNLVLLAAFLGIGLGAAVGARKPQWFRLALPLLAVVVGVLSFAEPLGLVHFAFPDPSISLWGAEKGNHGFLSAALVVLLCFWALVSVFFATGIPLGWLFSQMDPLRAYRWDIAGSLLGVMAMSLAAWAGMPPPVWFSIAVLPIILLRPSWQALLLGGLVIAAAWWSVGSAVFSPYNRLDVSPHYIAAAGETSKPEWSLAANRDYHQLMLDLSVPSDRSDNEVRRQVRLAYQLPFLVGEERGSAMIVGAGSGNDVAAALRAGFGRVVSVDIDAQIIESGRQLHPEQPYADPRVEPVANDARAWFEQNDEQFDVVCFGLLDSHAMFSAMSSLRLDNYVYTVEGIRAAWRHVKSGGILSVSFSVVAGDWMRQRIQMVMREATGLDPVLVNHGYNDGVTFLVGAELAPQQVDAHFPVANFPPPIAGSMRLPTDDWPFLYLRPDTFPAPYLVVVVLIAVTAVFAARSVFGSALGRSRFDAHMFLLGAGFMLLQTRMVTELSLLFGSTWIVNSCVIGCILSMILLANVIIERRSSARSQWIYLPLAASLALIWFFSAGVLNRFDLLERALLAGLIYSLPVLFAGLIFSSSLKRARDTSAALGANLCGAVFGGLLEYLSMGTGMKALILLTLALYLGSLMALRRQQTPVATSLAA